MKCNLIDYKVTSKRRSDECIGVGNEKWKQGDSTRGDEEL